jgi:CMP-N,N'-diacetyllegionaminic acid synthase
MQRVVCIIPARKGSKGLKRKNLRIVGLNTLVNRAIKVAKRIEHPIYTILTTDDDKISRRYCKKVDMCILRSKHLAEDNSVISDVVKDVLDRLEVCNDDDIVMILEPSSPNRTTDDLNTAIRDMTVNKYNSLISVSSVDLKFHPFKILKIETDGVLAPYLLGAPSVQNRQEIAHPVFYRNGIVYLFKIGIARKMEKTLFNDTRFIITNREVSNIDSLTDLWLARYLNFKSFVSRQLL